ncbi:LPS export ABC transporter periplasmic protein LptC [bacterium]|nr:LPS export ABC transporter periplasmic protein LptC [bacterium]
MRISTLFLIVLLVLFLGGISFFLTRKETKLQSPQAITFRLLLNKTHIIGRYNGKLQWELEAERTEKSSDERFTFLFGIRNGVFYEWERGKLYFEAEKATYDNLTKVLQLEDVKIWQKDLQAKAPVLLWDGDKGRIVCEKGARFTGKKVSFWGKYIELNLRESYLIVQNGALRAKVGLKL